METLTVAALTALHSLCHRIGLTTDEQKAIAASESPRPGPRIWRQNVRFLKEADAAGPGSGIDLGFSSLIFRWLGIENEVTCVERHGLGVEEALSRDCGCLAAVVRAVAGETTIGTRDGRELAPLVSGIWSTRAGRLASSDGSFAAVDALHRAVTVCHLPPRLVRSLCAHFVNTCERAGNHRLAAEARKRLEAVPDTDGPALEVRVTPVTFLLMSLLWGITHGNILSGEFDLDSQIERTTEEWDRIRSAAFEGRVKDIPIPTDTVRGWRTGDRFDEAELRACLESDAHALPVVIHAVEHLRGCLGGQAFLG